MSTYFSCKRFEVPVAAAGVCEVDGGILQVTKLEVVVEVWSRRLRCWSTGARIVAWIFTVITDQCSTTQATGRAISLQH